MNSTKELPLAPPGLAIQQEALQPFGDGALDGAPGKALF